MRGKTIKIATGVATTGMIAVTAATAATAIVIATVIATGIVTTIATTTDIVRTAGIELGEYGPNRRSGRSVRSTAGE
jgi:hypothetical protein